MVIETVNPFALFPVTDVTVPGLTAMVEQPKPVPGVQIKASSVAAQFGMESPDGVVAVNEPRSWLADNDGSCPYVRPGNAAPLLFGAR